MPLFNPNPIFLLTDLKASIIMAKNLINPAISEGGAVMMNHRLFQRVFISSFLVFLFFTDVGHTELTDTPESPTNAEQPPPADNSTQESSSPSPDTATTQSTASLSTASETTSGAGSSIPSSSFPIVTTDPNTGAAMAAIPIEVPPGRKGVQPNLTLKYNSNMKNGWIGVGWDIPIGYIQRNTKHGVNYSANDFVVDGSRELVSRGDWGADYYGNEIEGAFSKYYYNSFTGGWEVTTKGGTKYFYGTTVASRQDNAYGVFKWMLDKVQDTNGNYMTITYWKDQGEIYIDRIDYTGNGSLSPTNYVKFYWETRTDASVMYTTNSSVKTAYRLKTIDIIANGQRARAYALAYSPSTATSRSLLSSTQQYGEDATVDASGTVTGGTALPGQDMFAFMSTGSSFTETNFGSWYPGCSFEWLGLSDYNGDGKTDIAYRYTGCGNDIVVKESTGSSFVERTWKIWSPGCSYEKLGVGDFNGDGRSDILMRYTGCGQDMFAFMSTGSSFTETNFGSWYPGCSFEWLGLGDYDGDNKTDVAYRYTGCGLDQVVKRVASRGLATDLLMSLSNGFAGTTTITYTPSSSYTNTLLPFIVQTVSSITVNDGNGNISTTNYTYSGGLYDYANREFRGFGYVKATDPNGTTSETWFKQDDIFKGLPYDQITKDSSGNTYARAINTFNSTSPYTGVNFPYLSQKDDYIYDGTATYKQAAATFTYDAYGNITRKYLYGDASITGDERDEYIEYNYDTTNWILNLPSTTYVKDNSGNTKVQAWFTYNTKGNLLTKTAWLNGGTNPVITYTYDAYGNIATITDPKGNPPTVITYDAAAYTYPATIQNSLGHTASKTYDYKFGKPLSETDPNDNTTTYEYDAFGRPTKVTNPNDTSSTYGTVSYSYLDFGTVGSQRVVRYNTEQSGTGNYLWEEVYFDGLGRTIKIKREGPDGKVITQQTQYDQRGLAATKSLPYFEGLETPRNVSLTYDPVGRITQTTNPDNTITKTSYDKGRITFIDANDHKKIEEKDVYGRLIKVEEYTGTGGSYSLYAATTYEYDILGNLLKTIDTLNNQTTITYDTLGRKVSMNDPDMGTWSYAYDANGNLTSQKDAKNKTIIFTYDALNRITKKDYPAGTDAIYTYDATTSTNAKGRLTTMTDASGTTKYYYDKLGRLTKVIKTVSSVNYTTETTYDALGRATSIKYPDSAIVNYTYDAGGNLSQVTGYATYSSYNALGQAATVTYANGVSTTYQYYSTNNRLASILTNTSTQGLQNISYTYDNVGNIQGITDSIDSSRTQAFAYDHLNRLTQAQSTSYETLSYTYTEIGNIHIKEGITYTYGTRPHAVMSTSDGKAYTYDANGNMTGDTQRTIAYNYDNMPSSIKYNKVTTTFVYDGNGSRIKKTAGKTTTVYIGKLYECAGTNCTKYIFTGDTRIAKKTSTATLYYHQDHLGSSSVITNTSGSKVEEIHYLPFGGTWADTNSVLTTHKFTAQELDAETGLYYYGARYYNPVLARFISPDSIVPDPTDPQAFNRYSYVRNNPLIYTDPSGNSWLSEALNDAGDWVNENPQTVLTAMFIFAPGMLFSTAYATVTTLQTIEQTITLHVLATVTVVWAIVHIPELIPNEDVRNDIQEEIAKYVDVDLKLLWDTEHSEFGVVGVVNIKGVFHGQAQLSWTKDRDDTTTFTEDGSSRPMHVRGGPLSAYRVRIGEGKSELNGYSGFRPGGPGYNKGDEGDDFGGDNGPGEKLSRYLKRHDHGNFSLPTNRLKANLGVDPPDYQATEW